MIVWNGTSGTINNIDISGPATVSGTVVGSGDSQDVEPENIASGQVAFGMVFFEQAIPSGASFGFTASASQGQSTYFLDAQVMQANYAAGGLGAGSIVGSVRNNTMVQMSGPIAADVYCFNSSNQLDDVESGFTSGDAPLAPGASASFSTDILPPSSCSTFLVGSSGYSS